MPGALTDEEIVRRALVEPEAFGLLVERYEARLARYLERLGVALKEDREDILQNAFVKAYTNLHSFDPTLQFSSWMYRITHNEAMSFFRRSQARPQLTLDATHETLLTELADEGADTAALAEGRISRERLGEALLALSPRERDVLTLRYFEDRSYAEMSDILELPIGTVSTLIHRAKKALRRQMPTPFHP